jgi:hypothetical protein
MSEAAMPTVVIVEPHRELAAALQEVVVLARCRAITFADFDELNGLPAPPQAIVVRIDGNPAHKAAMEVGCGRLAPPRPKLVGLVSTDGDVTEAQRVGCDVVLREPQQVRALYDALIDLASASRVDRSIP